MNVAFGEKVYQCRQVRTNCPRWKVGDFLYYAGEFARVEAVQPESFTIEKLKPFTMVTIRTATGQVVPLRNPIPRDLYRPVRR